MLESIKAAIASVATSIKSSLPAIVAATTATVVTGGCIYYYTVKDGIFEKRDDNVRYVLEEYINQIALNSIVSNDRGGYAYTTDLDKMTEEIIKKLKEADSVLTSYTGKDKKEEVIKKLIKAELITQYPDLRKASEIKNKNKKIPENEVQGGIKIVRKDPTVETSTKDSDDILEYDFENSEILSYKPYEEFKELITNNDESARKYFSLKPSSVSSSTTGNFVVKTDESNSAPLLNKEELEKAIKTKYSGEAQGNLLSALDAFVKIQEKNKVNAVFAIAVTQAESTCGTNWSAINSNTYNWMSVRSQTTIWAEYESFADATEKFGELISGHLYFGDNKYSVSDIAPTYSSKKWGDTINEFMAEIYSSIGIDINNSSNVTTTTQSNTNSSVDIVVASWTKEETKIETEEYIPKDDGSGDEKNLSTETKPDKYTLHEVNINYQNMLSKESMPAGFLWSLLVMGENVDFILDLADLAINNTEIVIEAQDNVTVTTNTNVQKYSCKKNIKKTAVSADGRNETVNSVATAKKESTITTTVTTTQSNTILNLTYANTWVAIYSANYINTVNKDTDEKEDSKKEDWTKDAEWQETEDVDTGTTKESSTIVGNDKEYNDVKRKIIEEITLEICKQKFTERVNRMTKDDILYYLLKENNDEVLYNMCSNYVYTYIKNGFLEIEDPILSNQINKKIEEYWNNKTKEAENLYTNNNITVLEIKRELYNMLQTLANDMCSLLIAEKEVTLYKVDNKNANNIETTNSNTYSSAGKHVIERSEVDKEKNFEKYFNNSGRAKSYIIQSPEWVYEMLESQEKTANMIDLFKYLLYKATGIDFGVTSFDFSIINTNNFNSVGAYGTLPVNGTTISRDEFIECVKNYNSSSDYQNRFAQYAGKIYDICVSKNINPILCAAQAGNESQFGANVPSNSKWNYWGLAVYNDSKTGKEFNNIDEAINYYCDIIIGYQQPGSIAYTRSKEFAPYNDKITGNMNTVYDVLSAYMYLGDYHSGTMWKGVNTKKYITDYIHMECNHELSDKTTMEERAAYVVTVIDNQIVKIAKDMFGNKAISSGGRGSILEAAEYVHSYMEQNHYTYSLDTRNCLKTKFEDSKNGYPYSCCATYVSWVLYEAGILEPGEGSHGANDLANKLKQKGFIEVNINDIQPGDIMCFNHHIQIYAGNGQIYNAGDTDSIQRANPYPSSISCDFVLRAP